MNQALFTTAACALLLLVGCSDDAPPAVAPPTNQASPAAAPPVVIVPDIKPQYTLGIIASENAPKNYTVKWTAQVNTGGWTMKTDQVLVEDMMGKLTARIYAILEKPAAGEMVTQAVETLTGEYDAGEKAIEQVELSIKTNVRGVKSDFPALYSVVKTTGG